MATFLTTLRPTPFGFYDADALYQSDADSMVTFVLRRLGEDVLGVELTKKMVWACHEEATREFNSMMIEYQAKSNIASLLGMPTGSLVNGQNLINLTNMYVKQNLEFLDRLAEPYAAMIGYGGSAQSMSGSITLTLGRQDYNLYTELKDDTGTPLFALQPSGSVSKLQVYDVYHFAPVQYVFNSNLASNFVAQGLPVESYIPDTRFYVLPLFEDVLRAGMLKAAQKVRRSHYTYRIAGQDIRIFPTPSGLIPGMNDKLWIRVGFKGQPLPSLAATLLVSGTVGGPANPTSGFLDQSIYGASNPGNLPYGPVAYSSLNLWARNWIAQYCLAVSTELLGRVRSKFKNFPIPGAELTLNGEDLVTQGREDKDKLATGLRERLDALTYDKLAEMEASKAESMVKQLSFIPVPPSWALRMG